MIALLCKPREIENRRQIVALKSLGKTVESLTDVVLSRARLQFLDEWCKQLGLSNEPVIFQTDADVKAKKNSVLGRGQHPAAAPTDGIQPLLTRETMSYAISLSVSCVYYHENTDTSKSRASGAYERAITDLNNMSDPEWYALLREVLIEYVTLLTNPEYLTVGSIAQEANLSRARQSR